ncbi:regulatory protein, tetR family [Brevibacterium sandarakinum]|uniref:Regulatory protein, tetR family n=1 Tax=Brevibacterium sandarakinum TaxID=629680 RepID=A0A1H1NZJ9_BRESA|nr:TetR/AcrR family transcriptional regulator [Brevibacterium sandarakinum]SDS04426.1 regulatory protein, tetR family [Brevibacterium sandarakinum]
MTTERLDRRRVIDAAVTLLDAEGLDALSTRRLGAALQASANAMYWHVGSKDNLVGLAADAVFAELELGTDDSALWRERLAATARELRTMFTGHPWLTGAFAAYPNTQGPALRRFQNHLLVVCRQAGFEGFDLDWAGATVFSFVIGDAWGHTHSPTLDDSSTMTADLLEQVKPDLADYPLLLERYTALSNADPATVDDSSFDFGLCTLLDGLQTHLDHQDKSAQLHA